MTPEEIKALTKTVEMPITIGGKALWEKAFSEYQEDGGAIMSPHCRPCRTKVLNHLKAKHHDTLQ